MTQPCNGDQPSLPTPILHENLFKSKAPRRNFNQEFVPPFQPRGSSLKRIALVY